MNEEEKQAINYLKDFRDNVYAGVGSGSVMAKNIGIIFDIIDKQQKEIEELKDMKKELTERVLRLESDKFWDNVVSKDKIKEKIDLIDKEYAEFIEKNKNDLYLVNINAQRHDAMQTILEELLGGTNGKD